MQVDTKGKDDCRFDRAETMTKEESRLKTDQGSFDAFL